MLLQLAMGLTGNRMKAQSVDSNAAGARKKIVLRKKSSAAAGTILAAAAAAVNAIKTYSKSAPGFCKKLDSKKNHTGFK